MNKNTRPQFFGFLMVLATFAIAFGLDRLILYLREQMSVTFDALLYGLPGMTLMSLAGVILGFCVFGLYTKVFPALGPLAVWIIVVLGLTVALMPLFYWFGLWPNLAFFLMGGRYHLPDMGGLIAVAGLFALYKMKKASA